MRKVVFNGFINGEKFDNVQDYNKKMNELLDKGIAKISALSNTSIVNEPDVDDSNETEVEEEFSHDVRDFLPFFNDSSVGCYLDEMVSDDSELNEKNVARANTIMSETYDTLKNVLDNKWMTIGEAFDLINQVKNIRSDIETSRSENRLAINELEERIDRDKHRLDILKNTDPLIDSFATYYNNVFNIVKNYLFS
jgi:hypothetical protein